MSLKSTLRNASTISILTLALAVGIGSTTFAHVVVKPAEVVTAGFQTFTMGVPNEKDISTTSIKLVIPDGLKYVQPTQKMGWQIAIEKVGDGEDATVKSITWSGNDVAAGFRDDFTFSGQVPDKSTDLKWKAYQTYSDGTVVSWDKAAQGEDSESATSGPFSITKVVTNTAQDMATQKSDQAAADAKSTADRSFYTAIVALAISIIGIFIGTRKK